MLKSALSALLITFASSTVAQSAADAHCQTQITNSARYQIGFGVIELSGPPLVFDTWSVRHSIMTITFPDQTVELTTANTHPGALGDYIATTIAHREKGYEAFGVITDNADGNQLGLIQPSEYDGEPYCFGSIVRKPD